MEVIECTARDVSNAANLFNQYRMFYELPDDLEGANAFLCSNLEQQRSRVFVVLNNDNQAVAFAQIYPATCSLAMKHFYWLYDLYVDSASRGQDTRECCLTTSQASPGQKAPTASAWIPQKQT